MYGAHPVESIPKILTLDTVMAPVDYSARHLSKNLIVNIGSLWLENMIITCYSDVTAHMNNPNKNSPIAWRK